jgi:formate hydrogenlyase transcriptional activator
VLHLGLRSSAELRTVFLTTRELGDPMATAAHPIVNSATDHSHGERQPTGFRHDAFDVGSINERNRVHFDQHGRDETVFSRIIGSSTTLKSVLADVERVAPTDSTVLVLGETGTGKELIARAIHDVSARRRRPFVKVNCAAIPLDLLESELFGHEKGAFTGAIAQKLGRFEMADTGTLFLDEIGDLPLALQPKLLRILQEQEFERLGSGRTHRINVRLVTATHRDLTEMVARRVFRSDLYYRLNVFPIELPPLRERPNDIPQLVSHFVNGFSARMGKPIRLIPLETMVAFTSYSWPGNVRELQNLIERAVIRSNDGVLPNPLRVLERTPACPQKTSIPNCTSGTFSDSVRSLILRTLEDTGWLIGGPDGAAARLGLPRTSLISKMKKLGILRPRSRNAPSTDGRRIFNRTPVAIGRPVVTRSLADWQRQSCESNSIREDEIERKIL